jgi:hypothetical protein
MPRGRVRFYGGGNARFSKRALLLSNGKMKLQKKRRGCKVIPKSPIMLLQKYYCKEEAIGNNRLPQILL